MKNKWFISFLFLALLAGCKNSHELKSKVEKTSVIRIGFLTNLTHAQALLGWESGDFQKALAPAEISVKTFHAGPSLIEALFANEIDIAYVGPGPALNAHQRSKGQGIRVIAGAAANGVLIVAHKESSIRTLHDLHGKRVATPQLGNTQDISARHFFQETFKDKKLENILPISPSEQVNLMLRKEIDAAWVPEPWGSFLMTKTDARLIAEEKDLWPQKEFILTVVAASPQFLLHHPHLVEKFLEVHLDWTHRLQQTPQKYIPLLNEAFQTLTGKSIPVNVLSQALPRIMFTDNPMGETFKTYALWNIQLGFEKNETNLTNLIDLSLLQKIKTSHLKGLVSDNAPPSKR